MTTGPVLTRRGQSLIRRLRNPRQLCLPPSRQSSFLPKAEERRLSRLAEQANERRFEPEVQATYLRALGEVRPLEVVRRVEAGIYATNETVAKEYLKALIATGQLEQVKLSEVLRKVSGKAQNFSGAAATVSPELEALAGKSAGSSVPGAASAIKDQGAPVLSEMAGKTGVVGNPIHVALAEPSMLSQMWRLARVLGTTFLILGFIGVLMEERGVNRGIGISNLDVLPQPESSETTTFEDVKGCDEAKAELEELVHFLRSPTSFTRLGGKLPKGVLLMGPPGTGKTLLARAIAGEAQRPFFYASGSEFEEMFVGVGAKRMRELFSVAKQHAPCIVFIDEIDAIGGKRNPKDQRFLNMTLNQLLVELDGFQSSEGIIVIGATNFPESLDQALVRPGRFDRHVVVPNPDVRGRTQILQRHTRNIPLHADVDLEIIAKGTPGFSGAELANLVNMAALKAAMEDFASVAMKHLEFAKDKILMGAERKSAAISDETRRMTAYHEGGHALCCLYTEHAFPVYKATIVPRGQALGMVSQLPSKDMTNLSKAQMLAKLIVFMGGRAAEEIIFGAEHVTSGALSDFEQATELAEAMVTKFGMTERLGKVVYDKERESAQTQALIEKEVRKLLDESYETAKAVLQSHEVELHRLAKALLDHETLNGEEMQLAITGRLKLPTISNSEKRVGLEIVTALDPALTAENCNDDKAPA